MFYFGQWSKIGAPDHFFGENISHLTTLRPNSDVTSNKTKYKKHLTTKTTTAVTYVVVGGSTTAALSYYILKYILQRLSPLLQALLLLLRL